MPLLVLPLSMAAQGRSAADGKFFAERVRPFFARYCLECHQGEKPKGGLDLDKLTPDFTRKASRDQWLALRDAVQNGEMPPREKPRPAAADVRALADWITPRAAAAEALQGRVVLRRLNRVEYENTVRDLLAVDANLKELLALDSSADGFDNVGAALHTSSFALERYLEAGDRALNLAIANRPQPPPLVSKRYSLKDQHQVKLTTEKVFRRLDDGGVVLFTSSPWQAVGVTQFYPSERGRYRVRISAAGFQSDGKPVTYRVSNGALRGTSGLIGYFDAPSDRPTIAEFVVQLEARTTITILPYGLARSQAVHKVGADQWDGPGLAVQWVEVEGPLNESWPPPSHRRLFGDLPQGPAPIANARDRVEVVSQSPAADAERLLKTFARRAFRRAVTDADVKPYLQLVQSRLDEKHTFEQALRAGFLAVLVAPDFLFLRERPGQLDDFALAARLSYFLWSSMPDDELLAVAEKNQLRQPSVLRRQVERLLASPKAAAFVENFVGQWLNLREIDATEPSHILYPEFDHMLKVSMVREAELFFAEVLRNDLSLTNFVASDFSMLNGRLARHYGIPGVDGWEFRKVPLPADSHRGGVLTMAAVLKVTANGTYTHPVHRGVWVLERVLGVPRPRAPEVEGVEPDVRGKKSIRELLAQHRSDAACATCHRSIDPPGFALESFDVIGGYREHYRATGGGKPVTLNGQRMLYNQGLPVDPADVLPDGRRFASIDEFKALLVQDKDRLARALAEKLITYGTGGPAGTADRAEVDAIVARVRARKHGFRALVHEVVQSELFRMK